MRREALAVLVVGGCLSCAAQKPPNLTSDEVSGCDVPAATFVKVKVTLAPSDKGTCAARVSPEKVCIVQGGAVRWRIDNNCGDFIKPDKPALTIIQPVPRRESPGQPAKWEFAPTCPSRVDRLAPRDDPSNALICEVPVNAAPGVYKYGFEGQIDPLDPDVEVRRGGSP